MSNTKPRSRAKAAGPAKPRAGAPVTVGRVLAEMLGQYGTKHFFLLTGGDNAFLLDLRDQGIRHVLARSERSAAFMADAYARLTGQAAFVYGQFGPGAVVALSGLIDANFAKSPVVGLMSDTKTDVRHRGAYQEIDQVAMFRPFTKWAGRVERPDRAADMLRTAIRAAVSGSPGPAYLGVPSDMLLDETTVDGAFIDPDTQHVPTARTRPDPDAVTRAADLLASASQPVLLAGTGCVVSGAWDAVRSLAEAHDLPVVTSVGGKGSLPETHRLCHGVVGRYSRRSANDVLRQADVVLAVGTRLNDMTTDRGRAISPSAKIIQIDVDPASIGLNLRAEIEIVGDALACLRDLAEAMPRQCRFTEWAQAAGQVTEEWLADRVRVEEGLADAPISPVRVMAALREVLDERDLLVTDTGHMAAWTSVLYDVRVPGLIHLRTAGSLGWALPACLGAQLAAPDRRVVAVTGDGGVGYHLAELETAARLKLPVVVVVINNGILAFEKHVQAKILGDVEPTLTDFSAEADYAAAARALGAGGERVHSGADMAKALRRALDSGGPYLLDVITDPMASAPVTNYQHLEAKIL